MGSAELTILVADVGPSGEAPGWWHDTVTAHGGRALEPADGAVSLRFTSVIAALDCAQELQRGDELPAGDAGGVRIGVDTADEEAGLEAWREAAVRLCRRADPGQVLIADRVRALAIGQGGHEFREVAALEREDPPAPLAVWELLWREPGPRTRVRLCGRFTLELDGRDVAGEVPGGQAGGLLLYLVAARGRAADRGELIDVTWPEHVPRDPSGALRPLLSRVRGALPAPAALEGKERVRLALPEPVWLDVDEATRAIRDARAAARGAAWQSAREHAEAALELLRPGFLPDVQAGWVDARRRELEELELEALEWIARSGLALGGTELGAAERAGRELIARSAFRETGHRFLMEALAAGGNAAEALRVYEDLRVLLRDELGAAPAPELQALHARLLAGEAGAPASVSSAAAPPQEASQARVPLPSVLSPRERSAFVGRDRELEVLGTAWREARAGSRRLVLVGGEPGIGKTRLTSELARAAHAEGTVLYAGCQEEALVSYQPFAEALRHYARSTDLDPEQLALGPGAAELARLVPELAAEAVDDGVEAGADPETRRYLMFEAVSTLLAEVAARAPVILVLDDLHWADRATLHLLRHVVRASQQAPLLIVGTFREGEVGGGHPLAELIADLRRDRLVQRVSLDGLNEGDVRALIASHGGAEASSALVAAVHEQTEGNPFFVDEVLRHLIETGVLFERDGRWVSALTADEIGVPEGVKEVLAGRLGRLSEDCRAALAEAAVLGREFSFDVLSSMAQVEEDALIAGLEEALAAQLVVETDGRRGPAYAFTHALVRETLYGGTSAPRRQRMHGRAALAIEAVDGEDEVATIAAHLRLAGSAGDPAKAVEYSLRAGAAARELFAWDEAATHWDGAVQVMARAGGREAERAALLVGLADLMLAISDLGRGIAYLEQARGLYEQLGNRERAAQVDSRLGAAHALVDSIYAEHLDIRRAFAHFEAAREVLAQGPARRSLGHLENGVGAALMYAQRIPEGIDAATRAMEIGERLGDEPLWTAGAETYGWHTLVAGDLETGIATLTRAFDVADRQQHPMLGWMALNMCGQLTWGLGAPDEAQAFFERAGSLHYRGATTYSGELADGIGRCHISRGEIEEARALVSDANPAWLSHALGPLVDLWDGRWEQVESLGEQILATSRRNGNRWDEWAALHALGRVHHLRGELERASDLLEQALTIVVDGGARYFELWVRPDLARVLAERGRTEEARAHVDGCRGIVANGEDWRGRAGRVALTEAVVLAREDRMGEAQGRFDAADATFGSQRLPGDAADAAHARGIALARAGDDRGAAEQLDRALELLRDHGAGRRWLDRLAADRRAMLDTARPR